MFSRKILVAMLAAAVAPHVAMTMDPVANETHQIQSITGDARALTVANGMVFYDAPRMFGLRPSRGVRFPPGTYVLEGEDKGYLYFRSPNPLEFRDFKGDEVVGSRDVPGGIALGKSLFRLVPAGAYIDGEGSSKILVWKLGGEFMQLHDREWKKNF